MNVLFNHEKLEVYQTSIKFIGWLTILLEEVPKHKNIIDQIDRASISISLNIAEGNGKRSKKDHNRYIEIALGSTLESAACLDVMVAKRIIKDEAAFEGKEMLQRMAKMLFNLSNSLKV